MRELVQEPQIEVRVLFFGAARDLAGSSETTIKLRVGVKAAEAFAALLTQYPELQRFGRSLLFAINQEYANAEIQMKDGDELAVFPPVSGGSTSPNERDADQEGSLEKTHLDAQQDFVELTEQPIDVGQVARRVVLPQCGATVSLDGYAREWTNGRRTLHLVYEAYAQMALKEMRRLAEQTHERFEIAHIGIVHRIGRLEIGETSVVISVSAPHRAAAFAACEWAIRELKRTVPIWKKEIFADGEVWVEGENSLAE